MRYQHFVSAVMLAACLNAPLFAANDEASTATDDKAAITVLAKHPEFVVHLKSNRTTGYAWYLKDSGASWIEPVSHRYVAPNAKGMVGVPGEEIWTFRVAKAGFSVPQLANMTFVSVRPWEQMANPSEKLITVTTAP